MVSPGLTSCEHTLNTLRYADRVKELGAADPAIQQAKSSPTEGPEGMRMDDGVMSPEELQDSDLAQLRSLNQGELSADWYNFQVSVIFHNLFKKSTTKGTFNPYLFTFLRFLKK